MTLPIGKKEMKWLCQMELLQNKLSITVKSRLKKVIPTFKQKKSCLSIPKCTITKMNIKKILFVIFPRLKLSIKTRQIMRSRN